MSQRGAWRSALPAGGGTPGAGLVGPGASRNYQAGEGDGRRGVVWQVRDERPGVGGEGLSERVSGCDGR